MGIVLRILAIPFTPFFSDQDWFYTSARESLFMGRFPLLGIPTSITWLHQGPLWTYFLIPTLPLFDFHPIGGSLLLLLLNTVSILLIYFAARIIFGRTVGLIAAFIYSTYVFGVVHGVLSYHTSVVSILELLSFFLWYKRRAFVSGFFIGLLYQSHILTFVLFPLVIYMSINRKISVWKLSAGFGAGALPFILAGPVQFFGTFVWLIKSLLLVPTTSGMSTAYWVVLLVPIIVGVSWVLSHFSRRLLITTLLIFSIYNFYYIVNSRFLSSDFRYQPSLFRQLIQNTARPGSYLFWYLQNHPSSGVK